MKAKVHGWKFFPLIALAVLLTACATVPPDDHYMGMENQPQEGPPPSALLSPEDQYYVMQIENHTPFGLNNLPTAQNVLYNKGYDEVRLNREADFSVGLIFSMGSRDNPNVRAGNMAGGAVLGAAMGAIIGAATGHPGTGAAIGAASGGFLGLAAPAQTGMLRIDMNVYSFRERQSYQRSRMIDLSHVPPPEILVAVDGEVSRMLQSLPNR